MELTPLTITGLVLCFLWSGFIRSGLGFGGLVLTLPFALMVVDSPLHILPVAIVHAFLIGTSTMLTGFHNIDWRRLGKIVLVVSGPVALGLLGLITIPEKLLLLLVFGVVMIYSLHYIHPFIRISGRGWSDLAALILGGYLSGLALLGSPLIVSVAAGWIERRRLRDSLLALWVILAPPKLAVLYFSGVDLHLDWQWWLLPTNLVGHYLGLKFHDYLLGLRSSGFYRWLGVTLMIVVLVGIARMLFR